MSTVSPITRTFHTTEEKEKMLMPKKSPLQAHSVNPFRTLPFSGVKVNILSRWLLKFLSSMTFLPLLMTFITVTLSPKLPHVLSPSFDSISA